MVLNNYNYIIRYFGHGTGEQYCRRNKIKNLDRCAVTLLFGCSSGRLKLGGEFDPSGVVLSYLLAGR
jgi:separase